MIWIIASIAICVYCSKSEFRKANNLNFADYILRSLLLLISSSLAAGLGLLISLLVALAIPKEWRMEENVRVESISTGQGVSGSVVRGYGTVSTNQLIFFCRISGDGTLVADKVKVEDGNVIFHEQENIREERLKIHRNDFVNPFFYIIAIKWPEKKYDFFVPKGSVRRILSNGTSGEIK